MKIMSNDIITTLHPDNDQDTNLYPNIKKQNIPNGSIDRSKLDDSVNSLLDSVNELNPSGVDTSTNILAFTTNKGIWIGSDTGHWYYWDGTQYVDGGNFVNTPFDAEMSDNSNNAPKTKVLNKLLENLSSENPIILSSGIKNGYYSVSNNTLTYTSDDSFSCSHFTKAYGITRITTILKLNASTSIILKHSNNTFSTFAVYSGSYDVNVDEDVTDIYVNFWNSDYIDNINFYTKKLVSNLTHIGNNLYNMNTKIDGKYMDYSNGVIDTDANSSMSQPIPVNAGETIWVNMTYHHICFLNKDKTFISGVLQTTQNPISVVAPSGAYYIVISAENSAMGEYLMVNKGESALPLEPYRIFLRDDYLIKEVVDARGDYNNLNERLNAISHSTKPYQSGWINFKVAVNQYIVDNSNTANTLIDDETDKVQVDCVLKLPSTYSQSGKPSKLLMVCHGAGRGVYGTAYTPWTEITSYNNMINNFVNAGYVVFDCNGYKNDIVGVDFWGCPRGVEAWRKAYDYVVDNYNVERSFSIYAFSMGGLTALNLAFSNFPNIKCIALGSPVTALDDDVYDTAGGEILLAYGMTTWDKTSPKLIGSNPIGNLITLNNTEYCFKNLPPLKIWFGSTEVFPSPALALRIVNAIKNAGGQADYRLVTGAGHEICYGENYYINAEYLYFIDRYNN